MQRLVSWAMILALVVTLLTATALPALASHGATLPAVALPAHGSIWFGNGLSEYQLETAHLVPPVHGSIWFGAGLERYGGAAVAANQSAAN